MIKLLAAALAGGGAGVALAAGHGVTMALLSAPLGASLSTLAAAIINGYLPSPQRASDTRRPERHRHVVDL